MQVIRKTKLKPPLLVLALVLVGAAPSQAIDIEGVRPASFTLPEVQAALQPAAGGDPFLIDFGFDLTLINISPAYLDTGTSGVVISELVADNWMAGGSPVPRAPGVTFEDVAIGGTVPFDVSQPLIVRIGSSTAPGADELANFNTVYNQSYGPMRVQIGPTIPQPDVLVPPNVFGMPVMMGKTVVIDPSVHPEDFVFQQSYIYNQNTPFNPGAVDTDPGIPSTSHHVTLSYGDFSRFTQTTGGEGPQLNHNPFIGPSPLSQLDGNPPPDNTPPVGLSFAGQHATASMLFDTGAVATFLSSSLAASLNVRYSDQVNQSGDFLLERFDPNNPGAAGTIIDNQFALPIGGIGGGASSLSGFFLDDLVLHTVEGSLNDADPNNLRYIGAPVLVLQDDIVLTDPLTQDVVILDGIFGMNFLLASANLDLGEAVESAYRWITFDEPTGTLGLHVAAVPEPGSVTLAGMGVLLLAAYTWRRRCRGC